MLSEGEGVSSITKKKLYDGTVELVFNGNGHRYTVKGIPVLGVTTILSTLAKPALIPWAVNQAINYLQENMKAGKKYDEVQLSEMLKEAKNIHRKKKEAAADLGTLVHKYLERYIKGEEKKLPENKEMLNAVKSFLKWKKENKVKFLESERVCYSKKYNFAGTCDFTCEIAGKKYVGDIKTSNAVYSEYMLQVAAYRYAMQEEDKSQYDGMLIVRVPKDATDIEVVEFDDYLDNARTFIYLLNVYKRMQIMKNVVLKGGEGK